MLVIRRQCAKSKVWVDRNQSAQVKRRTFGCVFCAHLAQLEGNRFLTIGISTVQNEFSLSKFRESDLYWRRSVIED